MKSIVAKIDLSCYYVFMQPRTFRANGLTWFQFVNHAITTGLAGVLGLHYVQSQSPDSRRAVLGYAFLFFTVVLAGFTAYYLQQARKAELTITADSLTYRSGTELRSFALAQATLRQVERGILQRSGDWILEFPDQPPFNLSRSECSSRALIEDLQARIGPIQAEPAQGH